MHSTDRRNFLKSGAGGLAGLASLPLVGVLAGCQSAPGRSTGRAAQVAAPKIETQVVAGRVSVISGVPGNVVLLAEDAGAVLVDSGALELAAGLQKALAGSTVRTLFNTHYHADQTGGNAAFHAAGAEIHAQTITKQWLATDYWVPGEMRWQKAPPKDAVPTHTFRDKGEMKAGRERIEFGYLLEAHTRGDAYVFFRDSNVLVAGDVVTPVRDPIHDWFAGGWMGGRVDALDDLLKLANEETRIVPAYGPVMSRAELQAERELMFRIFERTSQLMSKGHSGKDMLDAGVHDEFGRKLDDPARFFYDLSKGYQAHYTNVGANVV
jgi:glyoxylase-like metal-dependent hydrolase (beta-lactamase superfamily II)